MSHLLWLNHMANAVNSKKLSSAVQLATLVPVGTGTTNNKLICHAYMNYSEKTPF